MDLTSARVLVVGMARSGMALAEWLVARGIAVTACDAKPAAGLGETGARLESLSIPLIAQEGDIGRGFDLVVLSPGVPPQIPQLDGARDRGTPIYGDVEVASWFLRGPILGITGSNGKTTSTALCGHLLQASGIRVQVGGNIGNPVSAMIDSSREDQWNVLELSSFQLETSYSLRPKIGVALNVTPDHLDRHGTLEAYAAAKARLFRNQQPGDWAVLNAADPVTKAWVSAGQGEVRWFSTEGKVEHGMWTDNVHLLADGSAFLRVDEIPLRGRHNIENVLACAAAAQLAGASLDQIRTGVMSFKAVEHRLEYVRTVNGVAWFNDSKATNVDSTLKAIESFPQGLWVILGGKDKNSDYTVLREPLRRRARGVLLIGAAAAKISSHLGGVVREIHAGTLDNAVQEAHRAATPSDTVLLAPACASFDQFRSYEHRGQVFKQLVMAIEEAA